MFRTHQLLLFLSTEPMVLLEESIQRLIRWQEPVQNRRAFVDIQHEAVCCGSCRGSLLEDAQDLRTCSKSKIIIQLLAGIQEILLSTWDDWTPQKALPLVWFALSATFPQSSRWWPMWLLDALSTVLRWETLRDLEEGTVATFKLTPSECFFPKTCLPNLASWPSAAELWAAFNPLCIWRVQKRGVPVEFCNQQKTLRKCRLTPELFENTETLFGWNKRIILPLCFLIRGYKKLGKSCSTTRWKYHVVVQPADDVQTP